MRLRFRAIKDVVVLPLHGFGKMSLYLPEWVLNAIAAGLGWIGKAYYFMPGSHARRTVRNLCRVIGRSDPRATYFRLMDNLTCAAKAFGRLMRAGPDALAEMTDFDGAALATCREAWEKSGGAIFVVPHCVGSVLSAARFGKEFPSMMLVRESKSRRRGRIMRQYFEKLGPELLFVRRADPVSLARSILNSLRARKFVVGTTDLARCTRDTIAVEMFGERVRMPDWPARFAAKRKVPIVPGYVHIVNGRILMITGEPYLEEDLTASTQRWARFFEENIRAYPSDWIFMLDKRWSRILAAAAKNAASRPQGCRGPIAGPSHPSE